MIMKSNNYGPATTRPRGRSQNEATCKPLTNVIVIVIVKVIVRVIVIVKVKVGVYSCAALPHSLNSS